MRSFLSPTHPPSVIFLSLIQSISLSLLLHLAEYNYHESDAVPSRLILRLGCVPANTQASVLCESTLHVCIAFTHVRMYVCMYELMHLSN